MERVLRSHARWLTMVSGVSIVSLWTVFRHITNGVNFDVVGQIGLAQQWAAGMHSGAQLGATNYVLKMPLYALVNTFDFLSVMNRLLLLALICNVATFILLFVLFEKIMKLYAVQDKTWLYLAMLWLASIAGSVFWTDYANSRNLETVGGILFVYLVLKYIKACNPTLIVALTLVGSIVFFADSLQFYVCGLGTCLYMLLRLVHWRQKADLLTSGSVIGATLLAFCGAKLLGKVIGELFHVSFLVAPRTPLRFDATTILDTVRGTASSTLDIFGANIFKQPYGPNTVREVLGLLTVLGIIAVLVQARGVIRKNTLTLLASATIVINYVVYLASGQALVWATSRYLVMVPLLLIVIICISGKQASPRHQKKLQLGWLTLTGMSCLLLAGALVHHWPTRHEKDAHIYATADFLTTQGYDLALSSREVGVTTTYFADDKAIVLPLLCGGNHRLVPTDLFYDRAGFEKFQTSARLTPVIIPAEGIVSGPMTCTQQDVLAQFGSSVREVAVPGMGTALIYTASQLRENLSSQFVE